MRSFTTSFIHIPLSSYLPAPFQPPPNAVSPLAAANVRFTPPPRLLPMLVISSALTVILTPGFLSATLLARPLMSLLLLSIFCLPCPGLSILNSDQLPILISFRTNDVFPRTRRSYTNFRLADWKGFSSESEALFENLPLPTSCAKGEKQFRDILLRRELSVSETKD
jgi:hypothetical protein